MDNEELGSLLTTIKNQGEELVQLTNEVNKLQAKLKQAEQKVKESSTDDKPVKAAPKKAATTKKVAKKTDN